MASVDTTVLESLGHDLLESFVAVVVETFLYAIYGVLVLKAAAILLRAGRRVSLITLCAVLLLFFMRTALWVIDVRNVIAEIKGVLLVDSNDDLQTKYSKAEDTILTAVTAEPVLYAWMTIIGDSIIIWRVYAFWANGRERWVLALPLAFLLGSIIAAIMMTFCAARLGKSVVLGSFQHPAFCKNMQTTSYSTTLATTAVATLLIGYKTWRYRRTIRSSLDKSMHRTRAEKIMVILVESGILYFLFFCEPVILSIGNLQERVDANTNLHFSSTVYSYMTSTIVGMYPTIIVILVHSRHSFIDSTASSISAPDRVIRLNPTRGSDGTDWSSTRSRPYPDDVSLREISSGADKAMKVGKKLAPKQAAESSNSLV